MPTPVPPYVINATELPMNRLLRKRLPIFAHMHTLHTVPLTAVLLRKA